MKKLLPVLVLICFGALCLCMHLFVFHTVRVEGTSMVDTLRSGDIVLVTRFDYRGSRQPERGDVVECSFPGRSGTYIKRVIGLPGDRVEIIDSRTYVNGIPLSEPYATGPSEDYTAVLGEDQYLVLGDNRGVSIDSRSNAIGTVSEEQLIGNAVFRVWPLSSFGPIH